MQRVVRQLRPQVLTLNIEIRLLLAQREAAVLHGESAHRQIHNRLQARLVTAVLQLGRGDIGVPVGVDDDVGLGRIHQQGGDVHHALERRKQP